MNHTDDRRDITLPVTNEIGSEGGSYGDPTMQVETFEAKEKDASTPGIGGTASAAGYAVRRDDIVDRPAPDAESGRVRYPTEPPPGEEPRRAAHVVSPGLVGAAAGLAIGLLAARRR